MGIVVKGGIDQMGLAGWLDGSRARTTRSSHSIRTCLPPWEIDRATESS